MIKVMLSKARRLMERSKMRIDRGVLFIQSRVILAVFSSIEEKKSKEECFSFQGEYHSSILLLFAFSLFLWPTITWAASGTPSLSNMVIHLANQVPVLMKFATGLSVLIGFFMAFKALYELKEYGELRTMMSSNTDLRRPLTTFLVALILIYWPTVFHAMMLATFDYKSPIGYDEVSGDYSAVMTAAGRLIQLIGFISFIRGWVLLTHIGKQGSQPGALGKALSHIFGGLFAANIFGTFKILKGSLGFSA